MHKHCPVQECLLKQPQQLQVVQLQICQLQLLQAVNNNYQSNMPIYHNNKPR
ncbi:unnamed protein product [Meloidogyne enterolobii]|uniref:Uncharacterized protein n=1 Tax=Meloidogyne enterolobii TaxID=390850 RepID=A0ACB1AUW5_MELEN